MYQIRMEYQPPNKTISFKKKCMYVIEYSLMRFVVLILKLISWRMTYCFSRYLAYFMKNWGPRRRIVINNIEKCYHKATKVEKNKIIDDFYQSNADVICENFKLYGMSTENKAKTIDQKVTITNPGLLSELMKQHRSTLVISSHYANWEWLGYKLAMIYDKRMHHPFKHLKNPFIDRYIFNTRTILGPTLTAHKSMMKVFLKTSRPNTNNKGQGFILLTDQNPGASQETITSEFMGQSTRCMIGPEKMAIQTKSPMVYAKMNRVSRGQYTVELIQLDSANDQYTVTDQVLKILEQQTIDDPGCFLWAHDRWKER